MLTHECDFVGMAIYAEVFGDIHCILFRPFGLDPNLLTSDGSGGGLRSFAASWLSRWDILLFAYVQQLFHLGNHRLVFQLNLKHRFIFNRVFSLSRMSSHCASIKRNSARTVPFPGFALTDACRLISDDVVAAQVCQQHEHIERAGHGKEG